MAKTRVVIVGAGSAGLAALKEAQRYTDDVLLIDHGSHGTTCASTGCMPSKALLEVAKAYAHAEWMGGAGIGGTDRLRPDIPRVLAHVRSLRDRFVQGPKRVFRELGERGVDGRARLLGATTVEVNGRRIEAERIILAPGSSPVIPDAMRGLGERILTTDSLFEQRDLPAELAVVGIGAGGAELAQAPGQLGIRVTAFDHGETVAGLTDPAVNADAVEALGRSMTLRLEDEVKLEATGDGGVRVVGAEAPLTVERVLLALGRRPNVDSLGLETLGVPLDDQGLPAVDARTLQIGDLPVYLAGDGNDDRPLLHEAADEGRLAAHHAINGDSACLARRVPLAIVFTSPNIARIGQGWSSVADKGVFIGEADFSEQARALMAGDNAGRLRLYANEEGRLLGAELATPAGEHLAHQLAGWIQEGRTVEQALQLPFYHPTVEEGLRTALQHARRGMETRRTQPDLPLCHEAVDWALA